MKDATGIMPFTFILLIFINAIHWGLQETERFMYYPSAGWLRTLLTVINFVSIPLAALVIFNGVAGRHVMLLFFSGASILQAYSIWHRQRLRSLLAKGE